MLLFFFALITLALIFGFWRVFQPLEQTDYGVSDTQNSAADTPAAQNGEENKPAAPVPDLAAPAIIDSVELISSDSNLLADGNADVAALKAGIPRVYDRNPDSAWSSWWFINQSVYNRSKLGLLVTLKDETEISEITVYTRSQGGKIQWKALTPETELSGAMLQTAPHIAEASFTPTVSLKAPESVKTKQFLLWIDLIPRTGNENRAEIVEIMLK
ncbi:hypothetical protein RQN30_07740 [Arcanobacterium hippocoleae]